MNSIKPFTNVYGPQISIMFQSHIVPLPAKLSAIGGIVLDIIALCVLPWDVHRTNTIQVSWLHFTVIHSGRDKIAIIFQATFSRALSWEKIFVFSNLTAICSSGPNQQKSGTGSDNYLAPNRRQAIIWTNDDLIYWPPQRILTFLWDYIMLNIIAIAWMCRL